MSHFISSLQEPWPTWVNNNKITLNTQASMGEVRTSVRKDAYLRIFFHLFHNHWRTWGRRSFFPHKTRTSMLAHPPPPHQLASTFQPSGLSPLLMRYKSAEKHPLKKKMLIVSWSYISLLACHINVDALREHSSGWSQYYSSTWQRGIGHAWLRQRQGCKSSSLGP